MERGDLAWLAGAAAAVLGALLARSVPLPVVLVVVAVAGWRRSMAIAGVALLLAASMLGARAWAGAAPVAARAYSGPATLVTDPVTRGPVTHVVLRIEGKRYDVWATGSPRRLSRRGLSSNTLTAVPAQSTRCWAISPR